MTALAMATQNLGALKSHPKMLFSTKRYKGRYQGLNSKKLPYKGRYQGLETFDRRKVRKIYLMIRRLAEQLFWVRLRRPENLRPSVACWLNGCTSSGLKLLTLNIEY
jgi:hypothetical protein